MPFCAACGVMLASQEGEWRGSMSTTPARARARGRVQKKSRAWKLSTIADIYVRDGRACHYCAREMLPLDAVERWNAAANKNKLPPGYPTLDHVIPKSRGGTWALDNLVVACPVCNNRKGRLESYAVQTVTKRREVADARRCDLCHGRGTGWNEDSDKPCPDCRGAGAMSIDRYAELLQAKGIQAAKLRHKVDDLQRTVAELRALLSEAADDSPVWKERADLARVVASQRRTIDQMAFRIAELGGGSPRRGLRAVADTA